MTRNSKINKPSVYQTGVNGEIQAADFLKEKGMVLLQKRYHSPYGEIDLVMQDGDVIVFVEVKTRLNANSLSALFSITPRKQKRLIQTAYHYLSTHEIDANARMDVVTITTEGIKHWANAFDTSNL